MHGFNFGREVEAALEDGLSDVREIADRLTSRVPVEHLRSVVARLMPHEVRYRLSIIRRSPMPTEDPNDGESVTKPSRSLGRFGDSFEAVRRTCYLPGVGMVLLASLTAEQCMECAAAYRKQAAQNEAWAVKMERLARSIRARQVTTVADLPEGTLKRIMG